MRVKISVINQSTGEIYQGDCQECDLAECCLDGDEATLGYQELRDKGATLIGGGAAPLVLLTRVGPVCPVFRSITGQHC